MERCPLSHEPECAVRQSTADDLTGTDRYHRLVTAVDGMEMGWRMIREVHPDDDSVEAADRRHDCRIANETDVVVSRLLRGRCSRRQLRLGKTTAVENPPDGVPARVLPRIRSSNPIAPHAGRRVLRSQAEDTAGQTLVSALTSRDGGGGNRTPNCAVQRRRVPISTTPPGRSPA